MQEQASMREDLCTQCINIQQLTISTQKTNTEKGTPYVLHGWTLNLRGSLLESEGNNLSHYRNTAYGDHGG